MSKESLIRCPYCDNTGDIHGLDGEWRGECVECKPKLLKEPPIQCPHGFKYEGQCRLCEQPSEISVVDQIERLKWPSNLVDYEKYNYDIDLLLKTLNTPKPVSVAPVSLLDIAGVVCKAINDETTTYKDVAKAAIAHRDAELVAALEERIIGSHGLFDNGIRTAIELIRRRKP